MSTRTDTRVHLTIRRPDGTVTKHEQIRLKGKIEAGREIDVALGENTFLRASIRIVDRPAAMMTEGNVRAVAPRVFASSFPTVPRPGAARMERRSSVGEQLALWFHGALERSPHEEIENRRPCSLGVAGGLHQRSAPVECFSRWSWRHRAMHRRPIKMSRH
jgi:hypothetical protein